MSNAANQPASFRDVDLETYDTTTALAHAADQAIARRYEDFLIVDVDSHHYETDAFNEIAEYIEDPVFRHEAKFQGFSRAGLNQGNGAVVPALAQVNAKHEFRPGRRDVVQH